MTKPEDMTNELEWLKNNWPLLGRFEYKPEEVVHTTIGRVAELLNAYRLGAAGSASPNWPEPSKRNLEAAKEHVLDKFPEFQGDELEALARSHVAFAGSASPWPEIENALAHLRDDVMWRKDTIVNLLQKVKAESGSVSTHGPRPKMPICPDCGALMQTGFYRVSQNSESAVKVRCRGNDLSFHEFVISNFGELRRFFAAAPAESTEILGGNTMEYQVVADKLTRGDWRVEAINHAGEGECFVTIFSGPDSETRAKEYASWKNQ